MPRPLSDWLVGLLGPHKLQLSSLNFTTPTYSTSLPTPSPLSRCLLDDCQIQLFINTLFINPLKTERSSLLPSAAFVVGTIKLRIPVEKRSICLNNVPNITNSRKLLRRNFKQGFLNILQSQLAQNRNAGSIKSLLLLFTRPVGHLRSSRILLGLTFFLSLDTVPHQQQHYQKGFWRRLLQRWKTKLIISYVFLLF